MHLRVDCHVVTQHDRVEGFVLVIQLLQHVVRVLRHNFPCGVVTCPLKALLQCFCHILHNPQIGLHLRHDVGALNLDDDARAIRQGCPVYLRG